MGDDSHRKAAGRRKRSTYHYGDLVGAIRRTALEYIAKRGTTAFTMRELASDIGVTHGAVYSHYKNKQALLEDLALVGIQELQDVQTRAIESCEHALEKLERLAIAYVEFACTRRGAYRLIFNIDDPSQQSSSVATTRSAAASIMVQAIGEAQDQNLIVNESVDVLAFVLWSATHGLSHLLISEQVDEFDRAAADIDSTVRFATLGYLNGVATPRGRKWLNRRLGGEEKK